MRLLRQLDDTLQAGQPVPPWLVEALHAARVKAERGCSLEVVLGVDRGRRDAALRRAGELLHPDPAASPAAAAGAVLRVLEAFQRVPREPRTEAEEALLVALHYGPVPRSQRHIARILAG